MNNYVYTPIVIISGKTPKRCQIRDERLFDPDKYERQSNIYFQIWATVIPGPLPCLTQAILLAPRPRNSCRLTLDSLCHTIIGENLSVDWSLIIFVAVIVFFSYRGFKKGLLKSLSRVLSLVTGYIAAILYSKPLSVMVESWFQFQGIIAYITAALILFLGAGLIVSVLFWVIEGMLPESEFNSAGSRAGGTLVGLITGTIVAVVIVWTFNFLNQIQGAEDFGIRAGDGENSIGKLANQIASKAVGTAMSMSAAKPEIVKLSRAMIESPAEFTQRAQGLANSQDLQALLVDPANQRVLNRGDVKAVQRMPAFQQLAANPDMLALAKSAGMIDESTISTEAVEEALAHNITDIWGRVQRVKNDQRVREIMSDPEFQQKINSGNPLDMLSNAKLLELANIVFSDDTTSGNSGSDSSDSTETGNDLNEKSPTQLFSWTDDSGRIHYSDTAPESESQ